MVSYCGLNPTFLTFKTMSQSGPRSGNSLDGDERPVLSAFRDSQSESRDWITGLRDYVATMREHYPG